MTNGIEKLKQLDSAAAQAALPELDVAPGVLRQIELRRQFRPEVAQRRVFMAVAALAVIAAGVTILLSWPAWDICRDPMAGLLTTISGGLS